MSLAAFNQQYDQLMKSSIALYDLQFPISEGVVGVAKNQKEIAVVIDKLINDFEKHDVMKTPEEEIKTLGNVENGITQINTNLKNVDDKEKEIVKTVTSNHALHNQAKAHLDQAEQEKKSIEIRIRTNQVNIEKTNAAIVSTRADIQRKENDVRNAERKVKKQRRKKFWWGVFTLGIGAIVVHQQLQSEKGALNQRRQILANLENTQRQQQDILSSTVKEQLTNQMNKNNLELKSKTITDQNAKLVSAQSNLNMYRGYLLGLSDSFHEIDSCVQRIKQNLQKVIDLKNEINNNDITPDSSIAKTLHSAYDQLNSSWVVAKQTPSLQIALLLPEGADNKTVLNAIKGIKPKVFPPLKMTDEKPTVQNIF